MLTLTTMLFHDEVRVDQGRAEAGGKKRRPPKQELDQTIALIEALSCPWDPSRYEDQYVKRLKRIATQAEGPDRQVAGAREEPSPVPDLMAALERSLREVKSGDPQPA